MTHKKHSLTLTIPVEIFTVQNKSVELDNIKGPFQLPNSESMEWEVCSPFYWGGRFMITRRWLILPPFLSTQISAKKKKKEQIPINFKWLPPLIRPWEGELGASCQINHWVENSGLLLKRIAECKKPRLAALQPSSLSFWLQQRLKGHCPPAS